MPKVNTLLLFRRLSSDLRRKIHFYYSNTNEDLTLIFFLLTFAKNKPPILITISSFLCRQTSTDFRQKYLEGNGSRPISMYAATAYDTIWTLALTFRRYLSLEWRQHARRRYLHAVPYEDLDLLKDRFIDIIESLDFLGISVGCLPEASRLQAQRGLAVDTWLCLENVSLRDKLEKWLLLYISQWLSVFSHNSL